MRADTPLASLVTTRAPAATILVRLAVGAIFLSEGAQKFIYPADLGVGRFEKIHLPHPEVLAPFVGTCEIVCGALLLVGFLTRLAALPLIATMLVAIVTTKLPILRDKGLLAMAHEARVDGAMLLSAIFLLLVGAGPLSLDARLMRQEPPPDA